MPRCCSRHVLGMSREQLVIGASLPLSQEQWQSYESILLRRLDAEPMAYITGRQEFWSKDFLVTPRCINSASGNRMCWWKWR